MKFKPTIFFFLLFLPCFLHAQLSRPGIPPGFNQVNAVSAIPFATLPAQNIAAFQAEDEVIDTILDIPWRFGENIAANLGLYNAGVWNEHPNGVRVWNLGISSPGAYTINLTFNRYRLPPGAELYIYNMDRSFVLGAFTQENNQDDYYFATSLVPGDAVIIEYVEPAQVLFSGELHLETVTHGYRNILDFTSKFGRSGSCNLNVACDVAKGWEDQIDAVMLMIVGNNSLCTGTLVNNTNFDSRPYVFSANHCYRNPSTLVFWFNWQSSTCENPSQPPAYNSLSGAVSRVRQPTSDAWLLELMQHVPLSYNPYYAGWDRSLDSVITETVVSIHHPRGDIKKFSYALDGTAASSYVGNAGSGTTHWRVIWSGGTTTEPSSSGAPLFNANGLIIGQLHGGYAACGNTLPDWFGRFGISWDSGNNASSNIRYWLDTNKSDAIRINGYRPSRIAPEPPSNLTAQSSGNDTILLSWELNQDNDRIMLAYNTSPSFGTPASRYTMGDTLPGGGVVGYIGSGQSTFFLPAEADTEYYFTAWSYNNLSIYSTGVVTSALSADVIINRFPYKESFDSGRLPLGWSSPSDTIHNWQQGWGNDRGQPASPFDGNFNLYFFPSDEEPMQISPLLTSPVIDFSGFDTARLSFYHTTTVANGPFNDRLHIYFRADEEQEWSQLAQITTATGQWTRTEINLPGISSSYQLGFQATWNGGTGMCLDAISIEALNNERFPPPLNLQASIIEGHTISLLWFAPSNQQEDNPAVAYHIYRNNLLIGRVDTLSQNQFTDRGLATGNSRYAVTAIYDKPAGESARSNQLIIPVSPTGPLYFLLVTIDGKGVVSSETGTLISYNANAPVTLEARPAMGHMFEGWYEGDSLITEDNTLSFNINRDYGLKAVFKAQQYLVETESFPEQTGTQSGGGLYAFGQAASISTTTPLGYRFSAWTDDGSIISTSPSFTTQVFEDRIFIAEFEELCVLSLKAAPPEAGTVKGAGVFEKNTPISIRAETNEGFMFLYWIEEEGVFSYDSDYSFVIEESKDLTAVFIPFSYLVELTVSPEGTAKVAGAGYYEPGETVTISAEPLPEWSFIGWYENDLFMTDALSYTFEIATNRLFTAILEPSFLSVFIHIDGMGFTIPAPGEYIIQKGHLIELSAYPDPGWEFKQWKVNNMFFKEPTIDVVVDQAINATAVFLSVDTTSTINLADRDILVYPNPLTDRFSFEPAHLQGTLIVEVFNTIGQLIVKQRHESGLIPGSLVTIDLSGNDAGVYLLRVSGNDAIFFQKIIKQ